ncbi:hypothetical protein KTT66_04165 [Lacticaseibacillus casei]|uniref:Uncharacterized protein n=1 Tax=Lacticaseibacillus huelsenbergensis TaxID=3035291 RepID=A0ABY8DU32_9LACO|nr:MULTISPECIES: hypothetical protein [Lacticaseibacillus]QVI38214.1 hypothetical protein KGS74_04335 [Lacticaseibacillus casei]QXG60027.1 hypothetical protein KTT66_04165 [Lacticaseibacillus casei]WFB38496.1 hypothetical protein LHUE1_002026 [Lacticaseibacillus huelsenbergensis]WFB42920.1 hypothetical protein LHUE2_000976 [Lacticaseibacillus huelsenbergensis]
MRTFRIVYAVASILLGLFYSVGGELGLLTSSGDGFASFIVPFLLGFVANWGMVALVIVGVIIDKQMRWWYLGYPVLMGLNIGLNQMLPVSVADQVSYLMPFLVAVIGGYMLYQTFRKKPHIA